MPTGIVPSPCTCIDRPSVMYGRVSADQPELSGPSTSALRHRRRGSLSLSPAVTYEARPYCTENLRYEGTCPLLEGALRVGK